MHARVTAGIKSRIRELAKNTSRLYYGERETHPVNTELLCQPLKRESSERKSEVKAAQS